MKYNKKIEKYNNLIDKDNKRRKLVIRILMYTLMPVFVVVLFTMAVFWLDWKEILILSLVVFAGYLLSKYKVLP